MHAPSPNLPDSVYAQQLQRGRTARFAHSLEDMYVAVHLRRERTRARAWFSISTLISLSVTLREVQSTGFFSPPSLMDIFLLLPATIALLWLSWSGAYERYYPRAAPFLISVVNVATALGIARSLAAGRYEELAALAMSLMATFFFMGLMFRQMPFPATAMVLTFLAGSVALGVPDGIFFESIFVLASTVILCAIVARDVDGAHRKSFLESSIINELAMRDGLSGLMNRRSFDDHLHRAWQQAMRDGRTISILMIDIDHFKRYNDTHGHLVGDVTLRSVAGIVQSVARRPLDLAARYGGEEFAVILYDLAQAHVIDIAERLLQGVRGLRIEALNDVTPANTPHVTVSIGAATITPTVGRSTQGAVQLADAALYEAKNGGRDRVITTGPEEYRQHETGAFRMVRR